MLDNDNNSRKYKIDLVLRSHDDLLTFFNLKSIEDLPLEMRKHFYAVSGACSSLAWKPYIGNSILDFTDPMNDIENPFNRIGCKISLYVSKTMLKKNLVNSNKTVYLYKSVIAQ